jgi:allantoicase
VHGLDASGAGVELVPRTRPQPDTRHVFPVSSDIPVSQVQLDVYPDGGVARLRVWGEVDPAAHASLVSRWLTLMPEPSAREVLAEAGVPEADVERVLAGDPPPPTVLAALLWDLTRPT